MSAVRFCAVLVAVAVFAAPASAHNAPNSRMHQIRHVMVEQWGPGICGDTWAIPIQRIRLAGPAGLGYRCQERYPHGLIQVDDQSWTAEQLCILVAGHEALHVAGWRAPRGQEYIAGDGTLEPWHSRRPTSVMYPLLARFWPPCARFR